MKTERTKKSENADRTSCGASSIRQDELAEALGLSKTTISRALSGNGRVSAATRASVIAAAQAQGYRTPSERRAGRSGNDTFRSGNVAVVLSRDLLYESEFFHLCLLGAAGALAEHHYETLLILCNTDEYEPLRPAVEKRKLDGVIFTRALKQERSMEYLRERGIPVVVIGSGVKGALTVDANQTSACRELAGCLVNGRCSRVAFIGGNTNYIVNGKRFEGIQQGLTDHSLRLDPELCFRDVENREACRTAVETAIKRRADAIICGDDVITLWTFEQLTRNGLAVPDEMLLASCYDSSDLAHHTPPITAVRIDARAEGAAAGEAMCRLINGVEDRRAIRVEHDIRLRESTRRLSGTDLYQLP